MIYRKTNNELVEVQEEELNCGEIVFFTGLLGELREGIISKNKLIGEYLIETKDSLWFIEYKKRWKINCGINKKAIQQFKLK